MHTTPASLLEQVRRPGAQTAWGKFVQLYTPLLFYWARRLGLPNEDCADLVQEVLATLVQKLPEFEYDPTRGFRNWLRTVFMNKWRDQGRRRKIELAGADELANVAAPAEDIFGEQEYRAQVARTALDLMQREFPEKIWKACWEHLVNDRPAAEVAHDLGIAVGTVYVAKSRVLRRLREELAGLLD
jgi:RNA polymerase sigma-70 factor (ECF subfamily)